MTTKTPTRVEYRTPTRLPPASSSSTRGRHTLRHGAKSALRNTPGDRFVPNRASTDLQFARFKMSNVLKDESSPPDKQILDKLLELQGINSASKTLCFNSPARAQSTQHCELIVYSLYSVCYYVYTDWQQYSPKPRGVTPKRPSRARKLPKTADRVLDAPNLLNDFCEYTDVPLNRYFNKTVSADLNVLDWGSNEVLAVALRDTVYLLDTVCGGIEQLTIPSCEYVASLAWSKSGTHHLALGTSNADVQVDHYY